jgi:hypothetical protein
VHVGNITDGAAGITMVARTVNAGASKAADSSSNRRDFPGTTPHTKRSITGGLLPSPANGLLSHAPMLASFLRSMA